MHNRIHFEVMDIALPDGKSRMADIAVIRPVGDNKTVLELEVTKEQLERWGQSQEPEHRKYPALYERWKEGMDAPVDGTPLRDWPGLRQAEMSKALAIGVHTVEEFASLSDQGLRDFGMGAQNLKQKAKNWLDARAARGANSEEVSEMREAMKAMQAELARLKGEKESAGIPLVEMTKAGLKELADAKGVAVSDKMTKDEMIGKIEEAA